MTCRIRFLPGAALALLLAAMPDCAHSQALAPRPPRAMRRALRAMPGGEVLLAQNRPVGPGLPQWLENHRNLPPAEQERALESEPSFRALPPQQQQRAINQLRRLQAMTPQQLNRRWALLRLTPEQRQQFNAAMQQYGALPPARQFLIHRALSALMRVPASQRQAAMATYPPLQQLSAYERQVLTNLLFWEPYFAGAAATAPGQGP